MSVNGESNQNRIGAVVLAAGLSTRMGVPKMALPWKDATVLGSVLQELAKAHLARTVVVTGGARQIVEGICADYPVRTVFNPDFGNGEMTDSIRVGMEALPKELDAVLIVLGDQPQIRAETISGLIDFYKATGSSIVVPSYNMHRGHPWLIAPGLWDELKQLSPEDTMRDFLKRHSEEIAYFVVDSAEIMADLDTFADYIRAKSENS